MIEHSAVGGTSLYQCFKCTRDMPAKQFLYTNMADTEEELKAHASNGTAWACEWCFLRSRFCRTVLRAEEEVVRVQSPEGEVLTTCIHCQVRSFFVLYASERGSFSCSQVAQPAWNFTCYGRWYETESTQPGEKKKDLSADALHKCIQSKFLVWGCNDCFETSQLCAYRSRDTGKWRCKNRATNATRKNNAADKRKPKKRRRFLFTMKKIPPQSAATKKRPKTAHLDKFQADV